MLLQAMSSRLHRHFEQRKLAVRHDMETRRSLLDAMCSPTVSRPLSPASFNARASPSSVPPYRPPSLHNPPPLNSLPSSRRPSRGSLPPLDATPERPSFRKPRRRSKSFDTATLTSARFNQSAARPPYKPSYHGDAYYGPAVPCISSINSPSLAMLC